MSLNNLKKMIIFSNDHAKTFVEKMVADESFVENRSGSAIIEQHIINDLLPANRNASMWVQNLYDGKFNIGDVLRECFLYLAAGRDWKSKYSNTFEIVQYAYDEYIKFSLNPDARQKDHFLSNLDSLANKIQTISKERGRIEDINEADWVKNIYDSAKKISDNFAFQDVYQVIFDMWDDIGDCSVTYRILADIVAMQERWRNTEKSRYELVRVLKNASKNWEV